jgi:hypothetical protein
MLLKIVSILVISLQFSLAWASESPRNSYISIDGAYVCLSSGASAYPTSYQDDLGFSMYYASTGGVSCERMHSLETLVGATALSIDGAALAVACTGIGLPYAVKLQAVGLGLHVLEFIIGNVPCDNGAEEEQIQRQINESVCEALRSNGINCDPNMINNSSSSSPII